MTTLAHVRDDGGIAYRKPQPLGMEPDNFIAGALDLDASDDDWIPQAPGVWFKPPLLSVRQGRYVNLLRVRNSGALSRHRHSGPAHAFTLRGRWRYLEHACETIPGSYVFEPPGETHTLAVPDDVKEMITLFHVTGGYTYVDPNGAALGYEDVFPKLASPQRHDVALGRGANCIERIKR